jgi:hypothetical protein
MALSPLSYAQVTVVDITTDSVDIFQQSELPLKNAKIAMAASILIPGLGQQYLGKDKSALAYIGFDLLSLFSSILFNRYSSKLEANAHGFAGLHAHISGGGSDRRYWDMVGEFVDVKSYNEAVYLNRSPELQYSGESLNWKWDDDSMQVDYNEMRKKSHVFSTAATCFIGAMVLNRVVSFLDIRASTRYKGIRSEGVLKIQPSLSSDLTSVGIDLSAQF